MKRCGALFMTALLLSCGNPLHRSDVRPVKLSVAASFSGASRTVVADPSVLAAQVSEIQMSLTSKDGYAAPASQTATAASSWLASFSVRPGKWDIAAVARNSGGTQIGSGTAEGYEVTAGSTFAVAIPITFGIAGQSGSVSFALSFPDSLGIDYVQGVIEENSAQSVPDVNTAGETSSATLSFSGLSANTYSLVLSFRRGGADGTIAGIFREKLVVTAGFTSASWVKADGSLATERAFAAEEFYSPETALGGLVIDPSIFPGTITFNPMVTGYNLGPVTGLSATVTFTATRSVAGQYLEYSWNYGAFNPIGSGETSPSLTTATSNVLTVRVTAPDRTSRSSYRVTFDKELAEGGSYSILLPEGGSLNFTVTGGKITIASSSGAVGNVTIPSEIGGYPVTSLANAIFSDNTNITSATVPDSVTTIGTWAFWNCSIMTTVKLPVGLTAITDNMLDNCFVLSSVSIPSTVTSIGYHSFNNCWALQTINIYRSVPPTLDTEAFYANPGTQIIYVPQGALNTYKTASVWKDLNVTYKEGSW